MVMQPTKLPAVHHSIVARHLSGCHLPEGFSFRGHPAETHGNRLWGRWRLSGRIPCERMLRRDARSLRWDATSSQLGIEPGLFEELMKGLSATRRSVRRRGVISNFEESFCPRGNHPGRLASGILAGNACIRSGCKGLGELFPQFVHRTNHAMRVTANCGEMAHAVSLFTCQQATDNFPNNQRPDQPILLLRFEEAHEAHARIK